MKTKAYAVVWKKSVLKDYDLKKVSPTCPSAKFFPWTDDEIETAVFSVFPTKQSAELYADGNEYWEVVPCTIEWKST